MCKILCEMDCSAVLHAVRILARGKFDLSTPGDESDSNCKQNSGDCVTQSDIYKYFTYNTEQCASVYIKRFRGFHQFAQNGHLERYAVVNFAGCQLQTPIFIISKL